MTGVETDVQKDSSMTVSRDPSTRTALLLFIACGLIMVVILVLDQAFPRGVAIDVLYITPVLLSLRSPGKRAVLVLAALCSVLIVAGYFLSPPGGELWKVLFNRAIAILAIWITAFLGLQGKMLMERREQEVREREKVMEEVKVLRGMLPICAWCKKVRNDKGYWTQLESYISTHSEATFSHGICPECMEKNFSGFTGKESPDLEPGD